ncbi:MAG: hypothetical protein HYX69_09265 [Planctomycetia bacterium]|nr:hypothetical protein [Planctomycetia bacterium]
MNTRSRRTLWHATTFCLTMAIIFAACPTASACPSCKAALAAQEGQGDLVKGFFWSIMFMLSMPFTILGSFSGYMYLLVRRARRDGGLTPSNAAIALPSSEQAAASTGALEHEEELASL